MTTKDKQIIFRCFRCKKNYEKDFNKELIQRFANIYEFCNGALNKFILLLRKGVYPYEYMDSWERFNEISLPNKESFYSNLNMEDITDVDYRHANRVFKAFKLKVDPAHFLSAPGLAWQACLKKTEVELELITDPDMLL